jgi:phospholipid/cholesterol/gamma-HCH transport system substrate-binding protein
MTNTVGRFRRTWQRVRTEPKLGRNVTVIALLVAVAAGVGGYILNHERLSWPWDRSFTFYATFADTPGVSPGHGQEVRIAGVHVGEIAGVDVDDRGNARLDLSIDPKYAVYTNATVVMRPKSPLNEMYVELSPGGPPAARLSNGDTLPLANSQAPVQIDQVLGHLDTNTREALTGLLEQSDVALANARQNLPGGLSATDLVAKHLQPVVAALQTRQDTLRTLVSALSEISTAIGGNDARLTNLVNSLDQTLRSLGGHNGDLASVLAQLPDVTQQLKNATTAVQSLSGQLDPTLNDLNAAAGTLPAALNSLTGTVDQLNNTINVGTPVVQRAEPVVRDLRPFVGDVASALPDLMSAAGRLNADTAALVPSLEDLGPFIINTRSLTSFKDGNGGILRGFVVLAPTAVPGLGLQGVSTPTQPYKFPMK